MRIGIEAQRIFRAKKHGMDIFALELIRNLQALDKENEYLIFVKDGPDKDCLQETDNFKIVIVPGFLYPIWEQVFLPLAVKKYQLDVLHCTANTAPLLSNAKTLITLHDIIYLSKAFQGGSAYQAFGSIYRKWVVPSVVKKAGSIVTVSNYEEATINSQLPYISDRLEVIYNGVNDRFFEEDVASSNDLNIDLPERYIFFLGNTAPKKNMKNVLRAYDLHCQQEASPLPLVVAETDESTLTGYLNELGLDALKDKIIPTGYVPHHLLPILYRRATVFLYPSLRESFGIPIIEAMACNTPVITSNTSSMPEVAGDAAMLIDPTMPEEIADAIASILHDQGLAAQLQSKGSARARDFQWSAAARRYRELYTSVHRVIQREGDSPTERSL